jgi:glycosyltransferase involved in cell wall biosynthesis
MPGMLEGEMKWGAFHAAEAFALPSHQENFGVAVAEALACSLPVLISNKVNIWREIVAQNAGFAESDDASGTLRLLQNWIALSSAQRASMRENARCCFDEHFEVHRAAAMQLEIAAG